MEDKRPRCEHLVLYPMENCAQCLRADNEAKDAEIAHRIAFLEDGIAGRDTVILRLESDLAEAKKDTARLIEAMKQACRISTNGKLSADLLAAIDAAKEPILFGDREEWEK